MNSHTGGRIKVSSEIARGPTRKIAPPAAHQLPKAPAVRHAVAARVIDQDTHKPVSGAAFEVLDAAGTVVRKGQTDWQGTVYHEVATEGTYTVRIVGPAFDEPSLVIAEKPGPGFDERSLKIVEQPAARPPGFDVGSLRFVA